MIPEENTDSLIESGGWGNVVCLRVKKNIVWVVGRVFQKFNIRGQKESY